jgi:transposase InsO family protein
VKAKPLGRKLLAETTTLFSADTILGWFRKLVGRKYDGSANRKGGRPKVCKEIIDLVLRFKKENPQWGYGRIHGYLVYLGFQVSRATVQRILLDHGYHPEPEDFKRTTWAQFLKSHWNVFCAVDFFSVELLTARGIVRTMVLFVLDIATRKVQIAGIHSNPNGDWMKQVARNLTDSEEGFLRGKRFLILDRDPLFTKAFKEILKEGGVTPVPTAVAAPMMNAHAERFVRAVKYEGLNKLILTNEAQLRYVLNEYLDYYHHERIHKGLGRMIEPIPEYQSVSGEIVCVERLGGLLKSYHRKAA